MNNTHIFSQVLAHIDWDFFKKTVNRYSGDKGAKGITCKSQFICMLFAHLAGADSLREICQAMATQGGNLNHMGVERLPTKSSLAYANEHRDWQIYKDMFEQLVSDVQPLLTENSKPKGFKGKLFSIDSTVIDLCLALFPWAKFHHKKGAVKLHTVLDHDGLLPVFVDVTSGRMHDLKAFRTIYENEKHLFAKNCWIAMDRAYVDFALFDRMTKGHHWFVTRLKTNTCYKTKQVNATPENSNILHDEEIELTGQKGDSCEFYLRRLVVDDKENNRKIELLSNNLSIGATTLASMYKNRWQVELFFKQLKQNLKIRSFVGTSKNAVKTQIYCALCAIVLLRKLKLISDSRREQSKQTSFSFSNMVTMLRISLFRSICLNSWLINPFIPPARTTKNNTSKQLRMEFLGQQHSGGGG